MNTSVFFTIKDHFKILCPSPSSLQWFHHTSSPPDKSFGGVLHFDQHNLCLDNIGMDSCNTMLCPAFHHSPLPHTSHIPTCEASWLPYPHHQLVSAFCLLCVVNCPASLLDPATEMAPQNCHFEGVGRMIGRWFRDTPLRWGLGNWHDGDVDWPGDIPWLVLSFVHKSPELEFLRTPVIQWPFCWCFSSTLYSMQSNVQ